MSCQITDCTDVGHERRVTRNGEDRLYVICNRHWDITMAALEGARQNQVRSERQALSFQAKIRRR